MKISCQSCQAKYTIADEKVLGKIVKIRCKKCGATIVVNGGGGGVEAAASAFPEPPGGSPAATDDAWTINVAEGDQRSMTEAEIVSSYHSGVINDDTFCWKDGMTDWLPLRDIETLYDACSATHAVVGPRALAHAAPARSADRQSPNPGPATSAGNGVATQHASPVAAPAQPAALRPGRAPASDLFGAAAQAGGEDDVMTSAPDGVPQAHDDPQKLTGERNENSVLFSLAALTSKGAARAPSKPEPGVEASGLIDIKQLSAQLHASQDTKKSRIDDIMNLSSGGAFGASLTAPTLSAPTVADYASASNQAGAGAAGATKGRGTIFVALAAGAFVVVAAVVGASMFLGGKSPAAEQSAKEASSARTLASENQATASPSASAAPSAASSGEATTAEAPPTTASQAAQAQTPAAKGAPAPKEGRPKETAPPPKEKENSLAAAMAPPPAAHESASEQPFNMGEAKARLAAAASAAQGCKRGDGPTGSGRVVVLFAPSGAAQSATISGPPFEGTPTGGCVAARFRAVRVPAFGGSPFSVSKSFSVN